MNLRSILKPDQSVMAAIATAGSVYAVYNLNVGSVAQAHATPANHAALESSRKKAGLTSFALVSGLFLITRDGNVAILGYASIAAMEVIYRHGIMADPASGRIVAPNLHAFQQAENVVPMQPPQDDTVPGYGAA